MTRILGLDFGEKRIGLALSDPTKTLASPLPTLPNNKLTLDKIVDLIKKNDVVQVIIGYPLNMDGTKSKICELVDKFVNDLKSKTEIEVILRDERLTSFIAYKQIIESVKSKKKRQEKALIDQFSARLILQEYLDEIKPKNS